MSYLMGIDVGSTRTKCVIFDEDGRTVSRGEADTVLYYDESNPTWSYWDPDKLWSNVVLAIRQALAGVKEPGDICAVTVTSFSCDVVPLDENNEPLYYLKSWHCPRIQPQVDKWLSNIGSKAMFLQTGRQPTKMDTIYYLDWLNENRKDICAKLKKVLLVTDYINFKLSGRIITDFTMANTTAAFCLNEKRWNTEYLGLVNFDENKMPDVFPSGTVVGSITKQAAEITGLSEKTIVVLGGHDNGCAALSAGVMDDDAIVDIVGTWEIVFASSKATQLTDQKFSFGLTENFHVIKDHFVTIGYEVSGYLLEWAKTNFFGAEEKEHANIWEYIIDQIKGVPIGSNGIVVLPFMSGRSCIYPNPESSCTILGLKNYHGKNELVHSILEGICLQTRELVEGIERAKGRKYTEMTCVGGPTRNHLLMQIKADVCGKRIKAMDMEHGTALGAAMIAGIGAGLYKDFRHSIDVIGKSQEFRVYDPAPENTIKYDAIFEYYKNAYKAIDNIPLP